MSNKITYTIIFALALLIPGNALGQISQLNSTNTNTTTAEDNYSVDSNESINATTTETTPIPDPIVEGEKEPIESNDLEWIPIVVDSWDENGLKDGKTMYHNSKTGETREPLPYSASGLPLCHDPLYAAGVLGNKCHDELDHDTCDPGFVDSGKGCEQVNCSHKPGSAGLPYPQDKRTECEKISYDKCELIGMKTSGGFCDNIYELFWDNDCFGFANAKECDDYWNNISPSDSDNNEDNRNLYEDVSTTTMQIPLTPSLEVTENITTILRLLLTQQVTGLDRILLVDQLEQILQSLLTDGQSTVNVEYDIEEDSNERTLTVSTSTLVETEMAEEAAPMEEAEEDGNDNGGGGGSDPEPEPEPNPEPEPEPPTPELPEESPGQVPEFG